METYFNFVDGWGCVRGVIVSSARYSLVNSLKWKVLLKNWHCSNILPFWGLNNLPYSCCHLISVFQFWKNHFKRRILIETCICNKIREGGFAEVLGYFLEGQIREESGDRSIQLFDFFFLSYIRLTHSSSNISLPVCLPRKTSSS